MAAEIREHLPEAQITMIPSGGGRFEVTRDGVPVFEKSRLKRHAAPGEIIELLRGNSGG